MTSVLHGNWVVDSAVMAFWVSSDDGEALRGRRNHGGSPYLPGCLPSELVREILSGKLDLFQDERTILLPTNGQLPLLEIPGTVPPGTRLVPWQIDTAETLAETFTEFIFSNEAEEREESPLVWSESMRYWYELARFARLLYERQYYAPGVTQLEGKLYPAWIAVFNEAAEKRWQRMLDAMPPVCRALTGDDDSRQTSPLHLALSFIDATVDSLLRHRIKRRAPRQISLQRSNSTLHRQWLNTLKWGHFREINGTSAGLQQFAADTESWTDYMRPASFGIPWRLGFDLRPPATEDGLWHLEFQLLSVKNPSQKLLAHQVWSDTAEKQYVSIAREVLLTGLGRALPVFPLLREALRGPEPTHCEMNRDDAASFMLESVSCLQRLGFYVQLPDWWESDQSGLGMRLRIEGSDSSAQDRPSFLGINDVVDYQWELALGEHTLSPQEFSQLVERKQRLVFRDGRWLRVDVNALEKSLKILENEGTRGQGKLAQVLKLGRQMEKKGGLRLLDVEMDSNMAVFSGEMLPGQNFKILPQPKGFVGVMPPYQIHGFSWMVFLKNIRLGACLADDMGLGKTIQMIAVLLHEIENGERGGPTLIVSPMSVVGNWLRELNRFSPQLRVMVHHGNDRCRKEEFINGLSDFDVIISTYNLVVRDMDIFCAIKWWNTVLDEAQNIKNPNTKQSTVIRNLKSQHRYCLTGTPIENRLTELWSLMDFLNAGYLGSLGSFRTTFSQPIEREQDQTRSRILQKIIRPFVLRRLKSDKDIIRDLPEKREMKVFCNLTAEQAGLYQALVDDMLERIRGSHGIERKGLVLATLTKLKQITNHPVHFLRDGSPFTTERSGKLQRLEEMLEVVLEANDRALIFSQFTEIGEAMRKKLQNHFDTEVLYLHGATPKAKRDEMIARFQNRHGPSIFLLSLKAGGVGLNLTAANHVFHFDRWWNPAIEDQATDRTYRIGQTKNVQVHKFICVGTVEEKIDLMIEEKKALADHIVTAGEQILTELSTSQLQEVFALSKDAVVE